MIIVDSNVVIDALAGKIVDFSTILTENDLAVCGVIRSEVLAGSNDAADTKILKNALDSFYDIPMSFCDWDELGLMIAELRRHGMKVPFPDVIIAYLAITTDSELWTQDKHFKLIQNVFSNLKLYKRIFAN